MCQTPAATWLCPRCAGELDAPPWFVPDQLRSAAIEPLDAALVDRFGRLHRLEALTEIGRAPRGRGITITFCAVSRWHATISRDLAGQWTVADHASANGTRKGGRPVEACEPLASGDVLLFGGVGLYFVIDSAMAGAMRPALHRPTEAADDSTDDGPLGLEPLDATCAGVPIDLPTVAMRFLEAPSGHAGYLEVDGRRVRLTMPQLELVRVLARRSRAEPFIAPHARGFVSAAQLVAELPWDIPAPTDELLRHLIRRTRKAFVVAGLGDLIEARRGLGYRLRVRLRAPL